MGFLTGDEFAATYDAVADDYAKAFDNELDDKPFDRALLDDFAASFATSGVVCDLGCGPGHLGAYLAERGCEVVGIDNSPEMIRAARELHPGVGFGVADMRRLPYDDGALAAVACFYALIHIPRQEVPAVLGEIARVIAPGGELLLAVHGGDGEIHVDNWFDHGVRFDATLFGGEELVEMLQASGFSDCALTVREPYDQEHETPRVYVSAKRAGA